MDVEFGLTLINPWGGLYGPVLSTELHEALVKTSSEKVQLRQFLATTVALVHLVKRTADAYCRVIKTKYLFY
jgi:hypothetical protein